MAASRRNELLSPIVLQILAVALQIALVGAHVALIVLQVAPVRAQIFLVPGFQVLTNILLSRETP